MSDPLRILYLGDIVGNPGRLAVQQLLPTLRQKHRADLVIVNAENAANGSGLTPELYRKLKAAGVDAMTLGDHVFKKKQIAATLDTEADVIRPANLPDGAAGKGWMRLTVPDRPDCPPVYVTLVLGRIFMGLPSNDPFASVQGLLRSIPEDKAIVLVETHAEATSEKVAMGWYLNGKAAAVVGSHTHVPTADARVLPMDPEGEPFVPPRGTAYVSDLGMCGPRSGVLGRKVPAVLKQMTTAMHAPFDVADRDAWVQGVLLTIDPEKVLATAIERIDCPADMRQPPFVAG